MPPMKSISPHIDDEEGKGGKASDGSDDDDDDEGDDVEGDETSKGAPLVDS